jgi:predicted RNA binding protein YcfA (HicA-like mRNA interferase family)
VGRGKNLKRGPWTAKDIKRVLKQDGWKASSGGGHQTVWRHPDKPGKFPVSEAWTSLRMGDPIMKGMIRTCKIEEKKLLRLLNHIYD